jgi:hypothetical protein
MDASESNVAGPLINTVLPRRVNAPPIDALTFANMALAGLPSGLASL